MDFKVDFNSVFFAERLFVDQMLRLFTSHSELANYLALYRLSIGEGRREAELGYHAASDLTGLHPTTCKSGLYGLMKRGFITRTQIWREGMRGSRYEVHSARQIMGVELNLPPGIAARRARGDLGRIEAIED